MKVKKAGKTGSRKNIKKGEQGERCEWRGKSFKNRKKGEQK